MALSFKRVTSSGKFIPEIDGLRFLAIVSVVFYHYWCLIVAFDKHDYADSFNFSIIKKLVSHGNFGVELFFVISGFILGLPFCKYFLYNGKKISIKNYFVRRLTRLEPPYIISLLLFGISSLFFLKMKLEFIVQSFFASLFYIHNLIFTGTKPFLNGVTWSLEIEVQFYILAPILAFAFFRIKSKRLRRIFLLVIICVSILISNYFIFNFVSILNYLHYFLLGFLLCDFYLSDTSKMYKPNLLLKILLITIFISVFYFEKIYLHTYSYKIIWEFYQLSAIFILYYYALIRKQFRVLSHPIVTNIGGMCYSIYLLHYPLIAFVSKYLIPIKFSNYSFINISIYCIVYTIVISIISAVFYLLIEKPCMDKEWPGKLLKKIKNVW